MKRTEPMSRKDDMLAMRAASLWADVVGPGVNRYTVRRYVADGVLHVYLSSGPLKSELSFRCDAIARSINDILGREIIKSIRFH